MADKPDVGQHNTQPVGQPNVKLTKKQQKEEKKLRKQLESKQAAEGRSEKLRVELEAKKRAKKDVLEKKRLEAERLEQVAAERRRVEAEERQLREAEELKLRMENIVLHDLVPLMPAPKKSPFELLRDAMADALKRKDVIDVLGEDLILQLTKFVAQSSDFAFKRELIQEGYSVATKVHPARILFDIGHGAGSGDLSVKNGERRFFSGLSKFLFSPPQDFKYRIQFDGTNASFGDDCECLVCRRIILESPPPSPGGFCLNLKKMFVTSRIAWRDLTLCGVIKEIEKEPARTQRLKQTLRRHRVLGIPLARVLDHEESFDFTVGSVINIAPKKPWLSVINDSTETAFKHLHAQKKLLTEFPPSLVECVCDTCGGEDFIKATTNMIDEDLARNKSSQTK